jgi:hypothetical protein|tara:strand:+ start:112 stop:699 length:588 start_codon:yes stop_codon:yes gene_type:complete
VSILKRDKQTIYGLKQKLDELQATIDSIGSDILTPEQRQTLDNITATISVDLDTVLTDMRLSDNVSELTDDNKVATVKAIREYVLGALQATGPQAIIEKLPVVDNGITLNHRPHSGRQGIFNFAQVRYTDQDGVATLFDLEETPDNVYRFSLVNETVDLTGKTVDVQYLYHLDPQELNQLIGNLILEGLVLIEAE